MNKLIILIILSLASGFTTAANTSTSVNKKIEIKPSIDDKIFAREYTYRASEDDSKNSSRKKAIQQLKILLSEEIGTHISSYLEIEKLNHNNISYQSVNNEIVSLSASITKLKILKEKWDGKSYYVKASVRVNEKRTLELILQEIRSKSSEKDVKRLNSILKEQELLLSQQNSTIEEINKKLVSQEIINEAKKNEITKMKADLFRYQKEEIETNKEAITYKSKIEEKMTQVKQTNRKANNEIESMKTRWKDTKRLLCSFTHGANKYAIEVIVRRRFTKSKLVKEGYIFSMCPDNFLRETLNYKCVDFVFYDNYLISKKGC
jgi:hypothetical protein